MTTTDPASELLRDRVLAAVFRPLTEVGLKALDSFFSLPLGANFCPSDVYLGTLSNIFDIGLPFSFLQANATANEHRRACADAVRRGKRAPASIASELHAGALLCAWGASVKFVPRSRHKKSERRALRTPDIEARWDRAGPLDVEVTRGDMRHVHEAVHQGLSIFVGALQPGDLLWNVVGFMSDASCQEDLNSLFDAALALKPGQSAECAGRWLVRAVALERREEVVGGRSSDFFSPAWWPRNGPTFFASSTIIGSDFNPVVMLVSLVPHTAYTNPILRKAGRHQGRPDRPYLIALDTSELPDAYQRIRGDLVDYFKSWDHVSGVLLFEPRFYTGIERKEWVVSVHTNPSAEIPLPEQIGALSDRGRFRIQFELTEPEG